MRMYVTCIPQASGHRPLLFVNDDVKDNGNGISLHEPTILKSVKCSTSVAGMLLLMLFAKDEVKDDGNRISLHDSTTLTSVPLHLHQSTGQADPKKSLQGSGVVVMVVVAVLDITVADIVAIVAVLNILT